MGKDTSKDIPFEIFNIIKQLVKTDKVYKANDLKKLLPVDSVTKGWAHPTNKLEFVDRKQPFGAGSDPSNIVDGCYPYGSIQVPGGTEPIVLHRDAVSGGGYFMLGTVISVLPIHVGPQPLVSPTEYNL